MRTTQYFKNRGTRLSGKRLGLFLTFEGIEGSGKTTQCHQLAATLTALGHSVLETREPGGTRCAERIRALLLQEPSSADVQESITPECETALVLAARSQHIRHQILPALLKNTVVLCDRFTDSTIAYQGFGRKLDMKALKAFNDFVTQGLMPNLTFLFDLPIQEGLARRKRAKNQNRLDRESQAFHSRVRRGFLNIAAQDPQRFTIINGQESPENIAKTIEHKVINLLHRRSRANRST
ncbi:MAG: thymidylate kinase [Nitrospirales bacterium]|nr:MAG: thymidylate kinase [Nitrospirales bacterium]